MAGGQGGGGSKWQLQLPTPRTGVPAGAFRLCMHSGAPRTSPGLERVLPRSSPCSPNP